MDDPERGRLGFAPAFVTMSVIVFFMDATASATSASMRRNPLRQTALTDERIEPVRAERPVAPRGPAKASLLLVEPVQAPFGLEKAVGERVRELLEVARTEFARAPDHEQPRAGWKHRGGRGSEDAGRSAAHFRCGHGPARGRGGREVLAGEDHRAFGPPAIRRRSNSRAVHHRSRRSSGLWFDPASGLQAGADPETASCGYRERMG